MVLVMLCSFLSISVVGAFHHFTVADRTSGSFLLHWLRKDQNAALGTLIQ